MQTNNEIVHNLAVYRSYENFDNRRFTTTFFGHDAESVRILAQRAMDAADKYSCPSLAMMEKLGHLNGGPEALIYYITLTTHSLE